MQKNILTFLIDLNDVRQLTGCLSKVTAVDVGLASTELGGENTWFCKASAK